MYDVANNLWIWYQASNDVITGNQWYGGSHNCKSADGSPDEIKFHWGALIKGDNSKDS